MIIACLTGMSRGFLEFSAVSERWMRNFCMRTCWMHQRAVVAQNHLDNKARLKFWQTAIELKNWDMGYLWKSVWNMLRGQDWLIFLPSWDKESVYQQDMLNAQATHLSSVSTTRRPWSGESYEDSLSWLGSRITLHIKWGGGMRRRSGTRRKQCLTNFRCTLQTLWIKYELVIFMSHTTIVVFKQAEADLKCSAWTWN